jgi:FKBP-type peptidyl-prolyl cis-trans isomerase FklB
MKLRWIITLLGSLLLASQLGAEQTVALKNQKEKLSYIMGLDIGKSLKAQPTDIDLDILIKGIKDVLTGGKPSLTEQEIREAMILFQKEMIEKQQAVTEKIKKEGEAFLSADKKKEGIVTLPSGLQYKVIKEGIGRKPKPSDTVTIHYRATLLDGREFDSSYQRGQPDTLQVNETMPGLMEALTLMQEGAKWLLFIPPNLGYGERGMGAQIGPNTNLIFEVELLSIQTKK